MAVLEIEGDTALVSPARPRRRRVNGLLVAALAWIALIALAAILADVLPIMSPTDMDMLGKREPPSAEIRKPVPTVRVPSPSGCST